MSGGVGGAHRPRPKRSLGQNFLVDPNLQRKIAALVDPRPDDEVLEIGPGQGALTRHLAGSVRRLVVVELDNHLAGELEREWADDPTVQVVQGDFLALTLEELSTAPGSLKVVGNIPYNITTPILFALLERRPRPRQIILMVQREVADRILAHPGSRTYGALAVGVQSVADVERALEVGRKAFRPVPRVDSAVIRILPHDPPRLTMDEEHALRKLTRTLFGKRRKQLQRILRDDYALDSEQIQQLEDQTGLDLRARPETLSPQRLLGLGRALGSLRER